MMNSLYLSYYGNQLREVTDNGYGPAVYDSKCYHDVNDSGDDFAYDANGNIRYDKDRGIAAIRYNLLNLPDTIQFSNGNQIIHTYDAAGNRLRTSYYTRKVTTTIPLSNPLPVGTTANYYTIHDIFHRNCVYHAPTAASKDYAIEFVHNSEGYIRYLTRAEHYHFYYIKDHLGNVRETYVHPSSNYKECIQRMQYYPSGLPWNTNYVANEQPYKYGGKEFVEMHGLDEYDSHARWYYPALARTTTMDPHSEDYYPISPYAWCGNNFVNATDPTGMDWYMDSCGNVAWFEGGENRDGFKNIGIEYTQEIGNGVSLKYSQNTLTSISYQTMSTTDFIAQTGNTGCKRACDMMLEKMGLNSIGKRINMAIANDNGVVIGASSASPSGFLAVTSALERGMPIEVGVDYKKVQVNNIPPNGDGMTDHFVLITGLTENIVNANVISCQYNFFDPRTTSTKNGTASSNYFIWDGTLFRGYFLGNTPASIPYVVTTIRCSK